LAQTDLIFCVTVLWETSCAVQKVAIPFDSKCDGHMATVFTIEPPPPPKAEEPLTVQAPPPTAQTKARERDALLRQLEGLVLTGGATIILPLG